MSSRATRLPAPYLGPQTILPLFAAGRPKNQGLGDQGFVDLLLERSVGSQPGSLLDHQLITLEASDVSFLTPAPGATVSGPIYAPLTPFDYQRLDGYQGVGEHLYRRQTARARISDGEVLEVSVYLPTEHTLQRHLR
jgi:hypothetical protein